MALGITTLELMPVAAFAGSRGWGYDGVAQYAPHPAYGSPDDLRAFVDAAHARGLSVWLDVVYNHLGPSGAYLRAYSGRYFRADRTTPWGDALDFRTPVTRRWMIDSALYWLESYRFDGLRLDATFAIVDDSAEHVLHELTRRVAPLGRVLVAEDDRNDPRLVEEFGFDALWADDFHHQVRVTLTGEQQGYYAAYRPGADGIAAAIRGGWSYTGQVYAPWGKPRGHAAPDLAAEQFIYCVQNHDQVGNRATGDRLHHGVSAAAWRAATVLLLVLPMTPLLFMGQEWAASTPFQYFTDHDEALGARVTAGRQQEFPWHVGEVPDPQAPSTFAASVLRWDERDRAPHADMVQWVTRLIALRRSDPVLATVARAGLDARADGDALVVELRAPAGSRRLVVNFGPLAIVHPAGRVLFHTAPVGALLPGWEAVLIEPDV